MVPHVVDPVGGCDEITPGTVDGTGEERLPDILRSAYKQTSNTKYKKHFGELKSHFKKVQKHSLGVPSLVLISQA